MSIKFTKLPKCIMERFYRDVYNHFELTKIKLIEISDNCSVILVSVFQLRLDSERVSAHTLLLFLTHTHTMALKLQFNSTCCGDLLKWANILMGALLSALSLTVKSIHRSISIIN